MTEQEFRAAFASYRTLSDMVRGADYQSILKSAADFGNLSPEQLEQYPVGGYSKGMISGAYQYVLQDLLKNIDQYDWVYDHLCDEISRVVFSNLTGYRIIPDKSFLKAAYDAEHPQYFDKNIVSCTKDEVFVDCGGFTGDTTEEFIRQFKKYKKIYVYEPADENIPICRKNLEKYRNITIRQCGVGEKQNRLAMDSTGSASTFMTERQTSDSPGIQIVSLDEDIQEPITFLKMDIEGFEIPALLGAKRHIREDFPKLAICTYHIISDIWEIPRLIDTIHPGYRFYIRHYNYPQNWETVIYAIPPEKEKTVFRPVKKRKRVAAMSPVEEWYDAMLLKDCGLIPYLLYKNHHCDASVVGTSVGNYSNLKYVDGLKMDILSDGSIMAKGKYLERNAVNIDCLLLYGCYPIYFPLVDFYKKCNPQGKVYLALDANSGWMDRIQWTAPDFCHFMDQCDVITAAGHVMQRHLNEKWPWNIEFVPNGFYNFSSRKWRVDFESKENIILTVGRLGTTQKATNVLLEAFAKVADKLPDWKLVLVGNVEESFEPYLNQFWSCFPEMKERISFLGSILDRDKLYDCYLRAKIFALPSVFEGAANVVAEALYAGNAIAVTKIDEYEDATDSGRCGMASEIGDVDGFANVLLQLCQNERLEDMCRHAYEYAQETFDMERAVAKIYKLIFGED